MSDVHHWFFTRPDEATTERRGDPLGFRVLADRIADDLAPGLSNRTTDARWLTTLCWMLGNAGEAWKRYDGGADAPHLSMDAARSFYTWLRPLELLWVARTLENDTMSKAQLPGRRAVTRWRERGENPGRFGMSTEQYQRYRSTGPYGAYRQLLRHLPGLTVDGGGWQLDEKGKELARTLKGPKIRSEAAAHERRGRRPSPESYWQQRITGRVDERRLPRPRDEGRLRQHPEERKLLRHLLFADGPPDAPSVRRSRVAQGMGAADAGDHLQLCIYLGSRMAREEAACRYLRLLGAFSALADAAVDVLDATREQLVDRLSLRLADFLETGDMRSRLVVAFRVADAWCHRRRTVGAGLGGPDFTAADELATDLSARDDGARLEALIRFHESHHGGLQWFGVRGSRIVRCVSDRDTRTSPYRFRLRQLARLAVQCGELKRVPRALQFGGDDAEA